MSRSIPFLPFITPSFVFWVFFIWAFFFTSGSFLILFFSSFGFFCSGRLLLQFLGAVPTLPPRASFSRLRCAFFSLLSFSIALPSWFFGWTLLIFSFIHEHFWGFRFQERDFVIDPQAYALGYSDALILSPWIVLALTITAVAFLILGALFSLREQPRKTEN